MKNNSVQNKFRLAYLTGFFIISALQLLAIPPYFFPPDWGKTIVFRSIMAVLLFLFIFQLLFKKNELTLPNRNKFLASEFKKNIIFWLLTALLSLFLLATLFSVDPFFSLWGNPRRSGGVVTFAFYFIFAVLAFIVCKAEDWKRIWNFSIVIGVLVSLGAVIQYYELFNNIVASAPGRPVSTMGNPILLATYILLLFFLTLFFALKEKILWRKIFYFSSCGLFFYVILITGSRAAYLGLAIGMLYFLLLYPIKSDINSTPQHGGQLNKPRAKKLKITKVATIVLLFLMAGFFTYVNTAKQYPQFLEQNKLFNSVASRLSLGLILNDSRFYAWTGVDYKLLLEKPILGYGPENFSVGFDKHYDPSLPRLSQDWGDWWDKAHNIFLDIGAQAGIFAIILYLALYVTLFIKLGNIKRTDLNSPKADSQQQDILAHTIQTTLVGYLVAIFFSFDFFSSYLIFFLLIGYSMHVIYGTSSQHETQHNIQKKSLYKSALTFILFCILVVFLWQYNLVPLGINAKINTAENLANSKQCEAALSLMETTLPQHSFLDVFARLDYVEFTKTCVSFYPENKFAYIKRGFELISEAVKIQPTYMRYWLFMGEAATSLASQEKDPEAKNNLLQQASNYLDKASQLGPKHQEVLIDRTKMEIVAGNYAAAQHDAQMCIALEPSLGDCWWYLALSQIYAKDIAGAQKNIQLVENTNTKYHIHSTDGLGELSDAYAFISDYQDLVPVYKELIKLNPSEAQYHSSLAFIYKQLGQYDKARQEALTALQLSPESKPNVDAFLKTLPQ